MESTTPHSRRARPTVIESKVRLLALVPITLLLSGWSTCNTEYDAPVFDVSEARIAAAFSRTTTCSRYEYIGGDNISAGGSCHMQGISRFLGRTMTSCQDSSGAGQGRLQLYPSWLGLYNGNYYTYQPTNIAPQAMRGDRDHPVVGQALEPLSGQPADALIPVVASSEPGTPAWVELRDGNGVFQCGFTHDAADVPFVSDEHLGAVALHAVGDQVYMAACSWGCASFYIYRLSPSLPGCGAEQLSHSLHRTLYLLPDEYYAPRSPISGTGDKTWSEYNSLAVFRTEEGSIYLVAGADEWLDTWRIDSPTSQFPSFHKIAKANWGRNQSNHGDHNMFYEGMTLEKTGPTTYDLWMAPHNYGTSGCNGIECTRAIYRCPMEMEAARELAPISLSPRT